MKLRTIGTGRILELYSSASTLIDGRILVDCGFGVVKNLVKFKVDFEKIDTVLITHLHADHFYELPALVLKMTVLDIAEKVKLYVPEGGKTAVLTIMKYLLNPDDDAEEYLSRKFEIVEYNENKIIEVENYKITPLLVDHGAMRPAYGFLVSDGARIVGLSGDSTMCENIQKIVEASDLAVLDASTPGERNIAHMGLDDVSDFAKKYPEKKIALTHTGVVIKEKAKTLNIQNLLTPEDGDEIEL